VWGPEGAPFYGRAIAIYLTLDQAGVAWENKGLDSLPDGSAFAMPAVTVDGITIGQTPAILAVLGEKYGLAGKDFTEKCQVLQGIEDMNDVFGEHAKFVDDAERKDKWFAYLEKKMANRTWIAGTAEPSVADFHGVFAFEWVCKKGIDFSAYPKMTEWLAAIKAYPVVKKMYASCVDGRQMIP